MLNNMARCDIECSIIMQSCSIHAVIQNVQERFLPACQLCSQSCSAGFIHHQGKCMASPLLFRLDSPLASRPLPVRPRTLLRVRQAAAAAAEDHHCRLPPPPAQAATQMLQPTRNQAAPSVRKRVCVTRRQAGGNLSYPVLSSRDMYSLNFWLAILSSCMFLASFVSSQGALLPRLKVIYARWLACQGRKLPASERKKIKIRQIPGKVSHMPLHHIFEKVQHRFLQ